MGELSSVPPRQRKEVFGALPQRVSDPLRRPPRRIGYLAGLDLADDLLRNSSALTQLDLRQSGSLACDSQLHDATKNTKNTTVLSSRYFSAVRFFRNCLIDADLAFTPTPGICQISGAMADPTGPWSLADRLRRAMTEKGIQGHKELAGAIRTEYNRTGRAHIKTVHAQTIGAILSGRPKKRGHQARGLQMLGEFLKGDATYFMAGDAGDGREIPVRSAPAGSLSVGNTRTEEFKPTTLAAEGASLPYSALEISIHAKVRAAFEAHKEPALYYIEDVLTDIIRNGLPKSQLRSGGDRG